MFTFAECKTTCEGNRVLAPCLPNAIQAKFNANLIFLLEIEIPVCNSLVYRKFHSCTFFSRNALQTLLHTETGEAVTSTTNSDSFSISNVFNFYNYLRTHPLLIRQKIVTAAPELKSKGVISGFTKQQTIVGAPDEVASVVDKVTPMERSLFFATAHAHYKNGNPILALEVLSKLPAVTLDDDDNEKDTQSIKSESENCITTGNISDFNSTIHNGVVKGKVQNGDAMDWSKPVSEKIDTGGGLDWGQPVSATSNAFADSMDWGAPVSKFNDDDELKLDFSLSGSENDSSDDESVTNNRTDAINGETGDTDGIPSIVVDDDNKGGPAIVSTIKAGSERVTPVLEVDIFAQQYKFIACLKVMMEEMQTLATGFEVDGGQLRYQVRNSTLIATYFSLNIWLHSDKIGQNLYSFCLSWGKNKKNTLQVSKFQLASCLYDLTHV